MPGLSPEREAKFRRVVSRRQPDLTVILENVYDTHNIGAVLRSCDSVGISEIFALYNEPGKGVKRVIIGKKTSAGSRKWVDVHYFQDTISCFETVRKKYRRILCTHLEEPAATLYELDLTQPTALLFGNERDGVTEASRALCDGNFIIPMMGMAASLNISVACAVSLYEAGRQRQMAGMYGENTRLSAEAEAALYETYLARSEERINKRLANKAD